MSAEVLAVERSDAIFTAWMRDNLHQAAEHFDIQVAGEPVLGWRLRSISAPVTEPAGTPRWLRVESARPEWASGNAWQGASDANDLPATIPRPRVLGVWEWASDGRRQRAELSTRLPGQATSDSDVLCRPITLPDAWWQALRTAVDELRPIPTNRVRTDQDTINTHTQAAFGTGLPVRRWETVHGDLHWANLLAPELGILDWELWGRGPAGMDAASLLCHSLLVPEIADRVYATFADVLDSEDGRVAQLTVAAWMFGRIEQGDYPHLWQPLREHAQRLGAWASVS
jgi:hypothetical protein